tara:strand:- start:3030 stop:4139 length:1110 start_codon:yes stop_codon:yes gene_type:complete
MKSKNKNSSITIIDPGIFSTIQDLGRYKYQKFGVPTSGALDQSAFTIGNLILGNDINNPGIETTMIGPKIKFNSSEWICVTGAKSNPKINDSEIKMWAPVYVKRNSVLSFGQNIWGVRSYILFKNTFNFKKTMDSYSTNTNLNIGGHNNGLQLLAKDKINFLEKNNKLPPFTNNFDIKKHYIKEQDSYTLRVILGPHDDFFDSNNIKKILESEYEISTQSNRIGFRLSGEPINHKSKSDIISEGGALGSIQIPGDGQPIILLQDRGTTGGYPKIATISSIDIPKLAQSNPGQKIRFKKIEIEDAISIYRANNQILKNINDFETKDINIQIDNNNNKIKTYENIKIDHQKSFEVNSEYKKKKYTLKIKLS